MYKLSKLPPPVPYATTGRVYKKPETRKYYELLKDIIKAPPDWMATWEEGVFVRLTVQFIFTNKHHADPENLNKALVNGIVQSLQRWVKSFDDKYLYIAQKKPIFGKKEAVIFSLDIPVDGEE